MSSPGPPWSPPTSILCPVFAVVCWVLVSAGFPSHLKKEIATHSSGFSCLENPMDRGAWQATVHGVPKSRTRLSHFTFALLVLHHTYRNIFLVSSHVLFSLVNERIWGMWCSLSLTSMSPQLLTLKSLLIVDEGNTAPQLLPFQSGGNGLLWVFTG